METAEIRVMFVGTGLIGTGRAGTEVAPFSLRMKGRATGNQSILRDLRFFRAATKPSRAGRGPERPHV